MVAPFPGHESRQLHVHLPRHGLFLRSSFSKSQVSTFEEFFPGTQFSGHQSRLSRDWGNGSSKYSPLASTTSRDWGKSKKWGPSKLNTNAIRALIICWGIGSSYFEGAAEQRCLERFGGWKSKFPKLARRKFLRDLLTIVVLKSPENCSLQIVFETFKPHRLVELIKQTLLVQGDKEINQVSARF